MFLMFKFTSLSFNQMGPTIPLTRGTRPAGSASQAMEECWEDLHLTCHSLETTATCTHTTAWWESVGSDQYILPCSITYIQLKKVPLPLVCLRTTRHTRCRPQTSALACHPCPASTAAVPAPHPSSPHLTPRQSTPQRELWVCCLRTPHL